MQGSIVESKIHSQEWRKPLRGVLERYLPNCRIYCHYSNHPNSVNYDGNDVRTTLEQGVARAASSDVVIAFLPSASMGTAIEMYEAHRGGAVVLTISPMQTNWVVRAYSDRVFADMDELEAFLVGGVLDELIRTKKGLSP